LVAGRWSLVAADAALTRAAPLGHVVPHDRAADRRLRNFDETGLLKKRRDADVRLVAAELAAGHEWISFDNLRAVLRCEIDSGLQQGMRDAFAAGVRADEEAVTDQTGLSSMGLSAFERARRVYCARGAMAHQPEGLPSMYARTPGGASAVLTTRWNARRFLSPAFAR
jgi:hypothetical protein